MQEEAKDCWGHQDEDVLDPNAWKGKPVWVGVISQLLGPAWVGTSHFSLSFSICQIPSGADTVILLLEGGEDSEEAAGESTWHIVGS